MNMRAAIDSAAMQAVIVVDVATDGHEQGVPCRSGLDWQRARTTVGRDLVTVREPPGPGPAAPDKASSGSTVHQSTMGHMDDSTTPRESILGSVDMYTRRQFAEATRVGDTVWVSGQRGFDAQGNISDDPAEQARVTFVNIAELLEK